MLEIPLRCSLLPLLSEAGVSLSDAEFVGVANLSSQLVLGTPCLCLLRLELQRGPHVHLVLATYVGSGDLNLSPHSQVATALTVDFSPQPHQGPVSLQKSWDIICN